MSESGQPGAATPGEHDDGTGQQDDLARSVSGWAPATGWSDGADAPGYRETGSPWNRADPAAGWSGSPARHGDLPAPFVSPPGGVDAPRNGRAPRNGHDSAPDFPAPARRPVSAPPGDPRHPADDLRTDGDDRLVVPAQRPMPPTGQQHHPESARHSSDDPSAPGGGRWPGSDLPSSAPPAMQVPPVGTAASGFEVPPGFHAPERGAAESSPTGDPRDWDGRFPAEGDPPGGADRFPPGESTADARPGAAEPPGGSGESRATEPRGVEPRGGDRLSAERRPAAPGEEPDWSGPSWNRPSWGGTWAPSWSRDEDPAAGRRGRADRAVEWSAEPARPYEPVRAEPARPYQPVRAEPARPYEPVRSEVPRPYELTRSEPVTPPALPEPTPSVADRPGRDGPTADRAAPGRPGADRPDRDRPTRAGRDDEHPDPGWPARVGRDDEPAESGWPDRAADRPESGWPDRADDRPDRDRPTRTGRDDDRPGRGWPARAARDDDRPERDWSERGGRPERSERDWSDRAGATWSDRADRGRAGPGWPERGWSERADGDWSDRSEGDRAEADRAERSWSDQAQRPDRDRSSGVQPAPERVRAVDRAAEPPRWTTDRPTGTPSPALYDASVTPPPLSRDESIGSPLSRNDPAAPSSSRVDPAAPLSRVEPAGAPSARDEPTGASPSGAGPVGAPSASGGERSTGLPGVGRADQPFRLPRDEPAARPVTPPAGRADQPFRLRSVPAEPVSPATPPGHPPEPPVAALGTPAIGGPRRLGQIPPAPAPVGVPSYAARRSAPDPLTTTEPVADQRRPDRGTAVLPQRVPAEPDVPVVPEPPAVEPPAETPELARIATHLRRDDEPAPLRERPEGFDVNAILDAVREVAGVRDAALRRTPAGAHSLRLDLSDGADPAEVSRLVARLLQERMGLAAAPQNLPGEPSAAVPPPLRRRTGEPRPGDARGRDESVPSARREPNRGAPTGPRPVGAGEPPVPAGDRPGGGAGPLAGQPSAGREALTGGPGRDAEEAPAEQSPTVSGVPRRRRQPTAHRGRASVEDVPGALLPPTGSPATLNASYSGGGQMTTTETAPSRPLDTGGVPGPRVVIDHVQVSTFGLDANVEVRLLAAGEPAAGHATGPAVDGYVLRLCAVAAAAAVDELLRHAERTAERGRCFVEHVAVVPFGNCEVATVVVLLVCDGWVEQLAGSALVAGDPRQAVVRATLAAVNRRLEALLA
ncbi:hypothetical protein GA0070623_4408 [Micromonospora rifamycinica]|uniref:Uncharacterized protein n=1 Tax=Micromonospora rifamycinica TaxID=291594 RepID=A0A1C5K6T4_9ACTN|nr:hypothetical protein GA0070623_4408 [Micromonospora rifamycinica]